MQYFENKTVLVADDDSANRVLVVEALTGVAGGLKVLSATNGIQAMDILSRRDVDVAVLDWEMPGLNGYEVLKQIRANPKLNAVDVLMYTGVMTQTGNLLRAFESGATDFIRKPTDPVEIVARIRSVLKYKQQFEQRLLLENENAEIKMQLLAAEVRQLQSDLSSYLLQLARKNEILLELKGQLLSSDRPEPALELIESVLGAESYWDDLFQRFTQIDRDFMRKLNERCGDLSAGEMKFCMLIRMGLGGKDIASVLNITAAGVEKKRYRLRKKLELDPEAGLEKAILNL